jgi:hypothetical protein
MDVQVLTVNGDRYDHVGVEITYDPVLLEITGGDFVCTYPMTNVIRFTTSPTNA